MRNWWRKIETWLCSLALVPFTAVMALASFMARLLVLPIAAVPGVDAAVPISPDEVTPFLGLILVPAIETLLFQAIPIRIASALGSPRWLQSIISTLLFALAHHSGGPLAVGVAAGSGIAFAWSFIRWSKESTAKGLLAAWLTHFWVNAAVFALVRVLG